MDFGKLLHTAQKNEKSKEQGVRYYSTKFEPPKKEKKSASQLSNNIKKFLAKKEAEEKQKAEDARKKRDELLALRSQDKKATKRVNVMLKRTKSANQSVLEDAIDNDNTAVTLAGPMQPDEDDYGYVSQEAAQYYTKMMEKYSKMPEEPPKFDMTKKTVSTNLGSTKDRVKAALDREREEAMMPHKRKRKHKEKKEDDDEEGVSYDAPDRSVDESKSSSDKSDKEKMPPPKPKPKPAPPPMNFADLLKIAAQKQHEPVVVEKKEVEVERPLTKKQRKEMERERESQLRREERRRQEIMYSKLAKAREKEERAKLGKTDVKTSEKLKTEKQRSDVSSENSKPSSSKNRDPEKSESKQSLREKPEKQKPKSLLSAFKNRHKDDENPFEEEIKPGRKYLPGDMRYKPDQDTKPNTAAPKKEPESTKKVSFKIPQNSNNNANKKPPPSNNSNSQIRKAPPSDTKPPREMVAPKGSMPQKKLSVEPNSKKFPPEDVRRKVPAKLPPKQFPPPDVRRSGSSKMVATKGGRILDDDDEDEYDSEMDDFIDDDDAGEDISSYISEIFGYDRKRFRDVDDDVDDMETSFAAQMKEEVISTKIGIMEDLEEERKEEEAKRRKMLIKKKMKRS